MKEIESGIRDTPSRTQKVAYLKATLSNLISNIQSAGETGRNRAQTHAAWKMGTMLQDPDLYDWQSKAKDALIEASKGVFSKESRRADVPRIINFQFDIGLKATPFDWDSKLSTVKEDTPLEYDIFAIGPNNSVNIGFKGGSKGGSNEQ